MLPAIRRARVFVQDSPPEKPPPQPRFTSACPLLLLDGDNTPRLVVLNEHAARGILGPPLTFAACARPLEAISPPLDVRKKVRLGGCNSRLCIHVFLRDLHRNRKSWDAGTVLAGTAHQESKMTYGQYLVRLAHLGTAACRVCLRCN